MVHLISMIAPVVVAGILILAVLTAIPSNALTTHSSSEYEKCVKSSNNCFLLNNESSNAGNGATSQESTGNGPASPSTSQESSNTGNTEQRADLAKTILDEHNRERAAVSVPALVWSDKLAADATAWAEHLAQTLRGVEQLKPEHHAKDISEGENIAQRSDSRGPSAIPTADLVQGWISEKNGYNHAPFDFNRDYAHAHYTQMVWRTTTAVGCGTANAGDSVYLVCRYSPPGNYDGQNPY
jgi:uncharacterized protein YkwD